MLRGYCPAEPFARAVAIFFALVVLALGMSALVSAPLSFDGAFFLFRVLDTQRFAAYHGRIINIPLQLPVLAAAHFTQNMDLLRLTFSAAYAAIPLLGLALSWLVCKSRRPSLFIWPAMSICIAGLPGQFFFQSETIMVVTLLWPALLVVLVGGSATVLTLVAITSVAAAWSHPYAAIVLAFIIVVAMLSGIARRQSLRASLGFAIPLGALLLARILTPMDPYEVHAASFDTIAMSFNDSVVGWPLVAIALATVAAVSCLLPARSRSRTFLMAPLCLAGTAMVAWAIRPANWAACSDYRFWVAPISLLFMSGAAVEELSPRKSSEPTLQGIRLYAVPLLGAIFFVVLSIQSLEWGLGSRRLVNDLVNSGSGCISRKTVASIRDTALDDWPVTVYAIELQGRKPKTLLLPNALTCQLFALNGDAIVVDLGAFKYVRRLGEGWFDFEDARSRTRKPSFSTPIR
jgi:hypothetical protein